MMKFQGYFSWSYNEEEKSFFKQLHSEKVAKDVAAQEGKESIIKKILITCVETFLLIEQYISKKLNEKKEENPLKIFSIKNKTF